MANLILLSIKHEEENNYTKYFSGEYEIWNWRKNFLIKVTLWMIFFIIIIFLNDKCHKRKTTDAGRLPWPGRTCRGTGTGWLCRRPRSPGPGSSRWLYCFSPGRKTTGDILTDGKNPDLFSSIKNRSIWKVKNTQRYPWKSLMKCLIIVPANLLLFCIIQLNVWFFYFFYQPYNPSLNDTLKSYILIIGELKQKTCIWKRAKP